MNSWSVVALIAAALLVAHNTGFLGGVWSRIKARLIPPITPTTPITPTASASLDSVPTETLIRTIAARRAHEKQAAAEAAKAQAILAAVHSAIDRDTAPPPKQ